VNNPLICSLYSFLSFFLFFLKREQASEHVVSTVQTCMKEYGFTVEQAKEKLGALIDEAWMDIVEECLDGGHPMALLEKAVNLARGMDHMYKARRCIHLSAWSQGRNSINVRGFHVM
jgi:hypothetical protein